MLTRDLALLLAAVLLAAFADGAYMLWKRRGLALPLWLRRQPWGALLEIGLIIAWAGWVAWPILDSGPNSVPQGGEFSNLVQTHYIWTLLPRCGVCFLWNGFINGGAPAFAELSGAVLHPLVFLPVLAWGVIQGAKVTFALSLALAGLAQWGLARSLGLNGWARIWSALMVIVGGHLAGPMDNGDVGLVLGQACAALVITYGVDLLFNHRRKALVGLGVALALTLLSGEGYIQIATALALLPALAVLCIRQRQSWRHYLLALGLALLLSGIFLAPLLHFLPQIGKQADSMLSNYPPLEYLPLNLVIRDLTFYRTEVLGKDRWLATHLIYIGWGPVLLAFLALRTAPKHLYRVLWAFLTGILLVFLITSNNLMQRMAGVVPWVGSLRHLTVASGLVVPLIVGLAAIALNEMLIYAQDRMRGLLATRVPGLTPARQRGVIWAAGVLIMLPFIILTTRPGYQLGREIFDVREIDLLNPYVDALKTPSAQWKQAPEGVYDWTALSLERLMKIGQTYRPWFWKDHPDPRPMIEAVYLPKYEGVAQPDYRFGEVGYFIDQTAEYAFVSHGAAESDFTPCQASSLGGLIDVDCPSSAPAGTLTLRENAWIGWYAWVDGQPAVLLPGQWLHVPSKAGSHHFRFRYLPWDVFLGLALTLAGMGLSVWWLRRRSDPGELEKPGHDKKYGKQ